MDIKKINREGNPKREINHRIDRLNRAIRTKSIEKAKAFKDLNISEMKINNRIEHFKKRKKDSDTELETLHRQKEEIKRIRKEIGFEHDLVVTEHAMLRYIERYMGINMDDVWNDIVKLPKADIIKYGNTIVTVYPEHGETFDDFK